MEVPKLKKLTKESNNKYCNLYTVDYDFNGKNVHYYFVSRNNLKANELQITKTNGVRILPYFEENDECFIVLIKEFRYPLNKFIYALPAGMVEKDEDVRQTAERELREEIGAVVEEIELVSNTNFVSAGLTDEALCHFVAKVRMSDMQNLDANEVIEPLIINLKNAISFVNTHEFCALSCEMIKCFYYKYNYEKVLKHLKETNFEIK